MVVATLRAAITPVTRSRLTWRAPAPGTQRGSRTVTARLGVDGGHELRQRVRRRAHRRDRDGVVHPHRPDQRDDAQVAGADAVAGGRRSRAAGSAGRRAPCRRAPARGRPTARRAAATSRVARSSSAEASSPSSSTSWARSSDISREAPPTNTASCSSITSEKTGPTAARNSRSRGDRPGSSSRRRSAWLPIAVPVTVSFRYDFAELDELRVDHLVERERPLRDVRPKP